MKKAISLFLVLVFIMGISGLGFAQVKEKKAKLVKSKVKEKPTKVKEKPTKVESQRGIQVEVRYGGGAGMVGIGYSIPNQKNDLLINAGYGIGSRYSIITAGVSGVFPLGQNYVGLELGLANYSHAIADIPGISGNIEKGTRLGIGIFGRTKIGAFDTKFGYNSALGFTIGAKVYTF